MLVSDYLSVDKFHDDLRATLIQALTFTNFLGKSNQGNKSIMAIATLVRFVRPALLWLTPRTNPSVTARTQTPTPRFVLLASSTFPPTAEMTNNDCKILQTNA